MPDLMSIFSRWWKLILGLTLAAGAAALIGALLSPKLYLSTATALPANSAFSDKARIFNNNIEGLYSALGSPDELDRMEGTAALDTLFLAAAARFALADHYELKETPGRPFKAAQQLKTRCRIARSAYGELKVKVWDRDPRMAATLANSLLDELRALHQHLHNAANTLVLQRVQEDLEHKQQQYRRLADSAGALSRADAEMAGARRAVLLEELQQYNRLVDQYQLAIRTNTPVLLTVEAARPALTPDKPSVLPLVLLGLFAGAVVGLLLAILLQTRSAA
jgi:uncharacterized protein involved in exopolysaccharide biosynthesis